MTYVFSNPNGISLEFDASPFDAREILRGLNAYWSGEEVAFGFTEGPQIQVIANSPVALSWIDGFNSELG